jgi:hypothetical protein
VSSRPVWATQRDPVSKYQGLEIKLSSKILAENVHKPRVQFPAPQKKKKKFVCVVCVHICMHISGIYIQWSFFFSHEQEWEVLLHADINLENIRLSEIN